MNGRHGSGVDRAIWIQQFDVAIPSCAQSLWQQDAFEQRNSWWLITGARLKRGTKIALVFGS